MHYFYDSYGNLSAIYYTLVGSDGSTSRAIYRVVTNAQGDVAAIHKNTGELVARYEYDAWGNTVSVTDADGNAITTWYHIANANPIRYRGYYYDTDLGLYYLQSRYYDSEIGRFINADRYISTGMGLIGYNMYAYCNNNPVILTDGSGTSVSLAITIVCVTLCAIIGGCLGYSSNEKIFKPEVEDEKFTPHEITPPNPNSNTKENSDSISNEVEESTQCTNLTTSDKILNTIVGATIGMAVGGGFAVVIGAAVTLGGLVAGASTVVTAGIQGASIGAVAFNVFAMVVCPFFGIELEPLEYSEQ